jgi:protein O-mannosyl-transferase
MKQPLTEKLRRLWPELLLVLAVVAVYGRILGHDFIFNWDDNRYVFDNPAIKGLSWPHLRQVFTSCYVGNYAPVQMLSYMLDHVLWGLRPGGYLLSNILLHALNGIVFYRLLLRLHADRCLALYAALIFLLHPVQVESVAWVSQRKNLLAMFFFLLAWTGYCGFRSAEKGKGGGSYAASLAAFVSALLAKSAAVILPPLLLLYDLCFPMGERRLRLRDKVPYLAAAAIVGLLAIYTQSTDFGGGRAPFHGGTPLATFYSMLPVFCRYLTMLVWPFSLSAVYAPPLHKTLDPLVIGAALLLALLSWLLWRLWQRDRRLGFWGIFFFVALLPVAQIVPLVTMMNDRYLYFPMLGAAVLAGAGASRLRSRWGALSSWVLGVPLLLLALLSCQRAGVWHDAQTLWRDAVAKSPTASHAWSSLAEVHFRLLQVPEAVQAYEHSLALDPQNRLAIAALGPIYTETGDLEKGYAMLRRYLALQPRDAKAWGYLGINYKLRGNYPEAERMYRTALTLQPDSERVYFLLGDLLVAQQRLAEARQHLVRAETLWPAAPEVAYRLACVEALAGRPEEALAWLEKALQRGYRNYDHLAENRELVSLWNNPRFTMLLNHYFPHGG